MPKNFNTLRAKMSPEARALSDKLVKEALAEMSLQELRDARVNIVPRGKKQLIITEEYPCGIYNRTVSRKRLLAVVG